MQVAVTKKLGDFVVNVRFASREGGVAVLSGPSGSGKTSVVNMVSGLITPDSGRITLGGRCVFDSEKRINLPPEKRRIGYVFQEGRLFPHLSVKGNLLFGMRLVPVAERKISLDHVVDLLGVGHLLGRRPRNLSGGEKQRVAIGRALLISPAALLMDEPFAALDQARKEELLPYIAEINAAFSIPIVYVSHSVQEIRALADTVVYLENGAVAGVETVRRGLAVGCDNDASSAEAME